MNKRNIPITLRGLIIHLEKQILNSDWHRVRSKKMGTTLLSIKKNEDIAEPTVQRCASSFTVNAARVGTVLRSALSIKCLSQRLDLLIHWETAFPNQP